MHIKKKKDQVKQTKNEETTLRNTNMNWTWNSSKKGYRVSQARTYETQVLIQFKMK